LTSCPKIDGIWASPHASVEKQGRGLRAYGYRSLAGLRKKHRRTGWGRRKKGREMKEEREWEMKGDMLA